MKLTLTLLVMTAMGYVILSNAPTTSAISRDDLEKQVIKQYNLEKLVSEIETIHCKMSDEELEKLKLTPSNIQKKHEFCNLSSEQKLDVLVNEFQKVDQLQNNKSVISGYTNSYTCFWDGLNLGIPTYQDMGLSSSSCSWTDPNPTCKNQGGVACLWGCTNKDPVLGWKTKSFSSKAALEAAILPKGYFQANTAWYSGLSYTRQLPYGHRYEVQGPSSGIGTFTSEGPEPNPSFNWYAFTNLWYPSEVFAWHWSC